MSKYLEFRNISTILTSILLTVFGLVLGYLSSQGLNLPVTADALASLVGGIILAVFSYYNAKHHNNLFDNETDTIYIPIDNLDDGQIDAINNFIDNCISKNIKHNADEFSDDPASAYEETSDGDIVDSEEN